MCEAIEARPKIHGSASASMSITSGGTRTSRVTSRGRRGTAHLRLSRLRLAGADGRRAERPRHDGRRRDRRARHPRPRRELPAMMASSRSRSSRPGTGGSGPWPRRSPCAGSGFATRQLKSGLPAARHPARVDGAALPRSDAEIAAMSSAVRFEVQPLTESGWRFAPSRAAPCEILRAPSTGRRRASALHRGQAANRQSAHPELPRRRQHGGLVKQRMEFHLVVDDRTAPAASARAASTAGEIADADGAGVSLLPLRNQHVEGAVELPLHRRPVDREQVGGPPRPAMERPTLSARRFGPTLPRSTLVTT